MHALYQTKSISSSCTQILSRPVELNCEFTISFHLSICKSYILKIYMLLTGWEVRYTKKLVSRDQRSMDASETACMIEGYCFPSGPAFTINNVFNFYYNYFLLLTHSNKLYLTWLKHFVHQRTFKYIDQTRVSRNRVFKHFKNCQIQVFLSKIIYV